MYSIYVQIELSSPTIRKLLRCYALYVRNAAIENLES